MNFKKIEWIFLIAFIVLDIFLFTTYLRQNDGTQYSSDMNGTNTTSTILKNIRNDQIHYGKLSNKTAAGFYVAVPDSHHLRREATQLRDQSWSYNDGILRSSFSTGIKISDSDKPEKTLNTVVKDKNMIIHGSKYKYNKKLSTDDMVVYTQTMFGRPVLSKMGQIRFYINGDYVESYSQGYISQASTLREEQETISQQRALLWLYQYKKITSNSTILWSQLGYSRLLQANGNTIYMPTWNFGIRNNNSDNIQYRRINAFTGAVFNGMGDSSAQ